MKTPMPKPVQAVCVMVSNIGSTHMTPKGNYYTSKQLRAAMVAAYNEAIEDAAETCRDMKQECGEPDSMQACLNRQMMSCSDAIRKLKETP